MKLPCARGDGKKRGEHSEKTKKKQKSLSKRPGRIRVGIGETGEAQQRKKEKAVSDAHNGGEGDPHLFRGLF